MTRDQELEALYGRCDGLEKKLRDIKFRISNIADECQYEHDFVDPIYICLSSLLEDNTAWELWYNNSMKDYQSLFIAHFDIKYSHEPIQ